jgi:predicted O-linked N-acetylglucosamine transferase (SPINDLY family)
MSKNAPSLRETMARAVAFHKAGRLKDAEALYRGVLSRHPLEASVLNLVGLLCTQDGRLDEGIEFMARALKVAPNDPNALFNFGRALQDAGRMADALAAYDRALAVRRDWPEAQNNRGNVLQRLHRQEEALASYDRAVGSRPDYVAALSNRAAVLRKMGRMEEAAAAYERVVARAPDSPYALGWLLHTRLRCCDWRDYPDLIKRVEEGVAAGKLTSEPWPFLGISSSLRLQQRCAELQMADSWPLPKVPRKFGRRSPDKLRVAWIGDCFRNNVETQTMVGLFELFDRTRFETFGVSLSVDDGSATRSRAISSFRHFCDAYNASDADVARWLRKSEVDIAVAIAPEMGEWRSGIVADRVAPLQVNLGYPGPLGRRLFDYTIADVHSVTSEALAFYGEGVARLHAPFLSYYRPDAGAVPTPARTMLGLPEDAFVFCAFNASYKIQPPVFDVWMRLLHAVDGSVLWLRADNALAAANLVRQAERRGIPASRLIFADAVPPEQHLARYAAADLFIDTFPYGAQTTAREALAAGLPVVTCAGQAMASRVAGGLVTAAEMGELEVGTLEDYEALIRRLATTPSLLSEIRTRLAGATGGRSLPAPEAYCRQLEEALLGMFDRHQRGLPPGTFDVSSPK